MLLHQKSKKKVGHQLEILFSSSAVLLNGVDRFRLYVVILKGEHHDIGRDMNLFRQRVIYNDWISSAMVRKACLYRLIR